jgi:hypothetical protein
VYLLVVHTTMLVHRVLRFALLLVLRTVCGSTVQKYVASTRRYPADAHMCILHAMHMCGTCCCGSDTTVAGLLACHNAD